MKKSQKVKIFVTGSDTNVGKTYVANSLIQFIISQGFSITPFKPIETGCKRFNNQLIPNDSNRFFKSIKQKIALDKINPYRFFHPLSPNKAIKLAKKRIFLENYLNKLHKLPKNDVLLIEGAGGLFSPIALDGLNVDLIKRIQAKTILVVEDKLGAINSALLNIECCKNKKINLVGIILNRKVKEIPKGMDNMKEIRSYSDIPIFQTYNCTIRSNRKVFAKLFDLIFS
ncbi:MAG: dethiobiotin synthase [Pseudomonadota bacterium]|nr:dethiobiotin synthase [Pseudomonadota bacterium]